MKNFKAFALLFFLIAEIFLLASCGGDEPCSHLDKNGDLICDKCDYEYPEDIDDEEEDKTVLIENGEPCFAIVIPSGCPASLRMLVSELQEYFEEHGTSLTVVEETKKSDADIEVLLGSVSSRGEEYKYDIYSLGYEGYAITPFDEVKIAVTGGSDAALISAFELFVSDYLGINYNSDEIEDVSIKEDDWTVEVFTNYRVKKILVGNTEILDYSIVRDRTNREHSAAAEKLQAFFYEKAGYYLPIINEGVNYENAIIIKSVAKNEAGDKGFRVRVDGKNLIIECAYDSMFEDAFNEFYQKFFIATNETITLSDFIPEKDISRVFYKDYGAVGDGKTNDFEAIKKAHEIANAGGQSVCAEAGATYYIEKTNGTIEIKTDTDFKGASFIFDDTALLKEDSGHIFTVKSDYNESYIDKNNDYIKALNENKNEDGYVLLGIDHGDEQTTKIDLGLDYPALITIYNDNHRNYLRYGSLASSGSAQKEIVLIDKDGNVAPSTPLLFDYTEVTKISISRIDVNSITVKNGNFTSLANRVNLYGDYYYLSRGICITRPNTIIDGLTHKITGEIPKNAPTKLDSNGLSYDVTASGFTYENDEIKLNGKTYKGDDVKPFTAPSFRGFIYVDKTNNILVKNCVLQARVHYVQGTYDINVETSNQVVFENCTQSNFFDMREENCVYGDSTVTNLSLCWGIAGTSYSKNLEYHSSRLTRYDAHAGVFNGKVIDSEIGVFRLIGGGNFLIEGTTVYAGWSAPIQFREDYGATFNGTITIKDTHFIDSIYSKNGKKTNFSVIIEASSANWEFGYTCHFPNLILDNITTDSALGELVLISSTAKTYPSDLYPERNILKEPVYDSEALFSSYLSFKDRDVFEKHPEYFKHLEGLTLGKDYTIVEQGDGVFTVVAHDIKNICTYVPPEFITIRNMDNFKNSEKKAMKFILYTSDFFKNTTITYEDGVIIRRKIK